MYQEHAEHMGVNTYCEESRNLDGFALKEDNSTRKSDKVNI